MANEIIALERSNGSQSFAFLYLIPAAVRIEIGGAGSGLGYPVPTPAPEVGSVLDLVLTAGEKAALDAGESVIVSKTLAIPAGTTDPQFLVLVRGVYAACASQALATYTNRYKFIGRRFDKE